MKNVAILLASVLLLTQAPAAKNCGKLDQPLQWTIFSTYVDHTTTAAITADGAAYINGQSGVETVINVCSGSIDATLSLNQGAGRWG
jgi:hypothetical protein